MAIDLAQLQMQFTTAGITQSAVRIGKKKGVVGMRAAARTFCAQLELDRLPSPADYVATLNDWTDKLEKEFPRGGRYWGVARKCLNIFMRDANYNIHLRKIYRGLGSLENVLEIPLDSYVAKGLLSVPGAKNFGLQSWDAIIRLTPEQNQRFQQWALKVAKQEGVPRVHLDLLYFPFP